jgi:hypothetical protein
MATVVFMHSWMDDHIPAAGWTVCDLKFTGSTQNLGQLKDSCRGVSVKLLGQLATL